MSETVRLIRFSAPGGADVMKMESSEIAPPSSGEVRIRHRAIGLNYIDVYHRSGLYPLPSYPSGLGLEASGEIESVGDGVVGFSVGDRVAYGSGPIGAYSEAANVSANRVVGLPSSISFEVGAAMMLKGMTARYLLRETYAAREGDVILVYAAAGGVGSIVGQWAKSLGVRAIGVAGGAEKAERALSYGYAHVIDYLSEDVAERVRALTDGEGVSAVYDSVGPATLDWSLASLRPRGLLVSFGNASGTISDFDLGRLSAGGSLYVTRPTLMTYVASDEALHANASDVIEMVSSGKVRIDVSQRYGLADVVRAHEDMESRRTSGASVLLP